MANSLDIGAQLFQQIGNLAGDEKSLIKILNYVNRLLLQKQNKERNAEKESILSDLRIAVNEVKLSQKGDLDLQSWNEFKNELDSEDED